MKEAQDRNLVLASHTADGSLKLFYKDPGGYVYRYSETLDNVRILPLRSENLYKYWTNERPAYDLTLYLMFKVPKAKIMDRVNVLINRMEKDES